LNISLQILPSGLKQAAKEARRREREAQAEVAKEHRRVPLGDYDNHVDHVSEEEDPFLQAVGGESK
jgi:hypothetical protein